MIDEERYEKRTYRSGVYVRVEAEKKTATKPKVSIKRFGGDDLEFYNWNSITDLIERLQIAATWAFGEKPR